MIVDEGQKTLLKEVRKCRIIVCDSMRHDLRGGLMIWDKHENFSSEFLAKHHDYVLLDAAHHIKAFLLYPPNCSCESACHCKARREMIILSLNTDLLNQAQARQEHPDQLHAMKMVFKIPDDSFFKANYAQSYPVWLIEERLNQEDRKKNFKIVEQLVWGLLRLARTYEISPLKGSRASINEAVEMIVGNKPLKTKSRKIENEPPICGEKAYAIQLNTYKSVCHFVAAYKYMEGNDPSFSLTKAESIQKFLSLSHWFRAKLLTLETPNVKERFMFSGKSLISLPEWISSDDIQIAIDPYEEKLQQINVLVNNALKSQSTRSLTQ